MKRILLVFIFVTSYSLSFGQYIFENEKQQDDISILKYASILNTGKNSIPFDQIRKPRNADKFKKLKGEFANLGFTSDNYWVKFQLTNKLKTPVSYYLRTAEPTTEYVKLYLINGSDDISVQNSGNNINFDARSVKYKKTLFAINLAAGETKTAFMLLKNDGRNNRLPLELITEKKQLERIYSENFLLGFFYGIIFVIVITYLFFYFALREISFLYYSLYILFAGLCQFALDGLYHQYIGKGHSWLDLNIIVLAALVSSFCFGKYSQWILDINQKNVLFRKLFNVFYAILGLIFLLIFLVPGFSNYSYSITSIWLVVGLLFLYIFIILFFFERQKVDVLYIVGMVFFSVTVIFSALLNFRIIPTVFEIEDVTKQGMCLQMIAFSLSMANRIRLLKRKEQRTKESALQKAEEMNNLKSHFLSNMSHELRTPLNAILGLAALMAKENIDPKLRRNYESIKYASLGLISSVNDILDFSRLEEGALKLDNWEFSPNEIIDKFVRSSKIQCADKNLQFEANISLDDNPIITGDPTRLKQIIHNLLGNAIKFTNSGKVELNVTSHIEGEELNLRVIIKDTGIGISEPDLEHIFGMFTQINFDNKRKHGGFGVGLSIARALTELHNGTLTVHSQIDEGTVCELNIKYKIQETAATFVNIFPEKDFDLMGNSVLVVEDNPLNQLVVQMILESWKGTKVFLANDGSECLSVLKTHKIDIILMDLHMPVMDGYEAIAAVKSGLAGDENVNVPIVVVTADITQKTKDRVYGLGIKYYVDKPVDEKTLYQKITTSLSKYEAMYKDMV